MSKRTLMATGTAVALGLSLTLALTTASGIRTVWGPGADEAAAPPPAAFLPVADEARLLSVEETLRVSAATPPAAYATLPNETTPAEARLIGALAYLHSVRPADGGDGPLGARRMATLVLDARRQYAAFAAARLAMRE